LLCFVCVAVEVSATNPPSCSAQLDHN